MAPSTSKSIDNKLLLKGYLPVRVRFPPSPTDQQDTNDVDVPTTFFYVKQHQHKTTSSSSSSSSSLQPTLFIANAPSYPPIDTATLLQALLGRLGGNIKRVTVVPNPRNSAAATNTNITNALTSSVLHHCHDWYFDDCSTDRFAHVVFESSKDLKQCLAALQRNGREDGCWTVSAVERQTLADAIATRQQQQQQQGNESATNPRDESEQEDPYEQDVQGGDLSGLQHVLRNYRRHQKRHENRNVLLQECNAVMEAYEQAEQFRLRTISTEPDDDGFVMVTHSTQPALSTELEQGQQQQQQGTVSSLSPRGTMGKGRSRKRKKRTGAAALEDFYRFQTKAKRQQDVQDLRQQFQQDLQRIQKIKESRGGFQPFG